MNCKGLKNLPSNLHKLQFLHQLNLHGCYSLDNLPALPTNITYLSLNGTAIEQVPWQIGDLTNLQTLDLGNCRRLKTVPKISMPVAQCLLDYNPPSFGEFTFMNSVELDENARSHIMAYAQLRILLIGALLARPGPHHEEPNLIVCCLGNEIPKWFNYQSEGSSLSIKLPPKWESGHPCLHNATEASFEFYPLGFLMNPVHHCYVKKCGVCLMYAQDSSAGLDQDVGEPKVGESSTSQRPREVSEPRGSRVVILHEEEAEEEPMPERTRNNNSNLLF
ncbi:hypothetical protein TIFTF001_035810 [Ficus carica]|nr:hypothetical protein TIFTF001_035794 [Ficus carica]GMN66747.1 hypothetical protein TIFTF001_035810 [Ficus carica]